MTGQVIEIAPFHLVEGKTEAELIAASERFQAKFLDGFEGFVRRSLVKHEDGAYADIVVWANDRASKKVVAAAGQHEAGQAYFSLVDMAREHKSRETGAMEYFRVVGAYG